MSEYVDTIQIDSSGSGQITLDAGEYELAANSEGFKSQTETVTLDSNQSVTFDLVEEDAGSEFVSSTDTDANGSISTTLEEGTYEVIGSSSGYSPESTTVTLDSDQSLTLTLEESTATTLDYDYEKYLESGNYLFVANHPDYWARIETVGVSGAPLRRDFTLQPYGDSIDTSGLTAVDTITTESDGSGLFESVTAGEYVLEFEHPEYQTKTLDLSHDVTSNVTTQLEANDVLNPPDERDTTDPAEPPTVGSPEGFDPGLDLPDGPAHFEVAVLDTDAGSQYEVPILVTNAGGELDAAGLRLELDSTGEVVTRRDMTLVSGGYAIARLSVRSLVNRVALPATVTVSTADDSETFELTSTADPRAVTGPGLPTTYGGDATFGSENPATFGRMREPPTSPDRDFPEAGWALVLQKPNGERRELTALVSEPDIEDVHTKASSWSVTVPGARDLDEWNFNTRAFLVRDGDIVNIGWCDSVESDSDSQETTLSGPGPFGEMPGDDVSVHIGRMVDWRAAQHIVEEVAPEWDITVLRTDDPLVVKDEEYSGNPLSILKSFCDDYSLYFRPSMTHFRQGLIFAPGGVSSTVDLEPTDISVNESSEGYANEVVFRGGEDDEGDPIEVVEPNDKEIQRLARERDVRLDDARETVRVEDADVTSESKARERAKGELRERITNYENGGSIEIPARRIQPGLSYPMPFDDEVWHSARAVRFDGDGSIELPPRMATRLDRSGAIVLAVKAGDWQDLTRLEGRLVAIGGSGVDIRTAEKAMSFGVMTDSGQSGWASAFESVPESGWYILHYDWEYDAGSNQTVIRAGHDGEVIEETTVGGAVRTDDPQYATLGRRGSDYVRETIIEGTWFCDDPQPVERYGALRDGNNLPAGDLVSRYDLDETPDETAAYDSIGGWHGTKEGTIPAGNPVTLDSASHSLTTTTGKFNKQMLLDEYLRGISQK